MPNDWPEMVMTKFEPERAHRAVDDVMRREQCARLQAALTKDVLSGFKPDVGISVDGEKLETTGAVYLKLCDDDV